MRCPCHYPPRLTLPNSTLPTPYLLAPALQLLLSATAVPLVFRHQFPRVELSERLPLACTTFPRVAR